MSLPHELEGATHLLSSRAVSGIAFHAVTKPVELGVTETADEALPDPGPAVEVDGGAVRVASTQQSEQGGVERARASPRAPVGAEHGSLSTPSGELETLAIMGSNREASIDGGMADWRA